MVTKQLIDLLIKRDTATYLHDYHQLERYHLMISNYYRDIITLTYLKGQVMYVLVSVWVVKLGTEVLSMQICYGGPSRIKWLNVVVLAVGALHIDPMMNTWFYIPFMSFSLAKNFVSVCYSCWLDIKKNGWVMTKTNYTWLGFANGYTSISLRFHFIFYRTTYFQYISILSRCMSSVHSE